MRLTHTFRTLAAAAGLALTLGAAAWAQEDAGPAVEGTTTEQQAAPVAVDEQGSVVDVNEGGAPDASGNQEGEAAPAADPEGGEEAVNPLGLDLPIIGQPQQGGIALQPAASSVAVNTHWLDNMVLWIISFIVLLVTVLVLWAVFRFSARRNPVPARFTHNSPVEIVWTVVPIIILVFIGAFSLPVLFDQQEIPEGDIHIKVTGYQWFWNYEYPDEGIAFDSYMIGYGQGNLSPEISAELQEAGFSDEHFRLATDTSVVVPVGATVVMTVTGGDVIHSWTVPSFGVKQDAVPGRLAHLWFNADQEGIYFGQCSELCGKDHAYMPIQVRVVSPEAYATWLEQARTEFPAS